ncbi:hypothetical protein WL54_11315 [Burkholderia ubonensis]|nr:hypothetical protein WL54_11315 [Burkholderia ubonensis]
MSAVFRLSALATSLALAACAVGPDYERPASVVSARFACDESQAMQHDAAPAGTSADADAAFWRGFGDPALTRLIDAALAANQDLQLAVSRYDASNVLLRETRFDQIPTITASGQIGHRLTSKDQAFGAPRDQRDKPTSSVGINAVWELDLCSAVCGARSKCSARKRPRARRTSARCGSRSRARSRAPTSTCAARRSGCGSRARTPTTSGRRLR